MGPGQSRERAGPGSSSSRQHSPRTFSHLSVAVSCDASSVAMTVVRSRSSPLTAIGKSITKNGVRRGHSQSWEAATIVTVSEIMIRSLTAFAMAHRLVGRPSRVTVEGIRIPEEIYHESLASVCLFRQGRIEIVSFIKLEASVLRRPRAIAWRNGRRMCHGFRHKHVRESNTLAPW